MLLKSLRVPHYSLTVNEDINRRCFVATMSFMYKNHNGRQTPITFEARSTISPLEARNAAAKHAVDFLKRNMHFEIVDYHYEELERLKVVHANCTNTGGRHIDVAVALGFQAQVAQLLNQNQELQRKNAELQTC
ncbi:hypothetical protein M5689_001074 [Euphorbia peplus]|nr:hypothetical protein M5689_001074 [Euphorbia peplus]